MQLSSSPPPRSSACPEPLALARAKQFVWVMRDEAYVKISRKLHSVGTTMGSVSSKYIGCGPLLITVTSRTVTCLVGDSHQPSFATATPNLYKFYIILTISYQSNLPYLFFKPGQL